MPRVITINEPVNELDSCELDCAQLTKEDGTVLTPAALETLTLTLYDIESDDIVNGLEDADILNVGRGTLDTNGHLVVALESADNPILTATNDLERRKALIVGTWNTGKGRTSQEVIYSVRNIHRVPTPP